MLRLFFKSHITLILLIRLILNISLIFLVLFSNAVLADEIITQKKGWYWYEVIETQNDEEQQENNNSRKPLAKLAPIDALMTMHPADIRELLKAHHEQAIWQPTPEHVRNYLIVQDVMQKKAYAMAAAQSYVMMTTPELNSNKTYPLNKVGMDNYLQTRGNEIRNTLRKYQKAFGLVFFVKQSCQFCVTQHTVLQAFVDRHGWAVSIVDISKNSTVAQRFSVEYTPQIIIVERGGDRWLPVAVGVEVITGLEENVYRAIRLMKNQIKPDQFFQMEFEEQNQQPLKLTGSHK